MPSPRLSTRRAWRVPRGPLPRLRRHGLLPAAPAARIHDLGRLWGLLAAPARPPTRETFVGNPAIPDVSRPCPVVLHATESRCDVGAARSPGPSLSGLRRGIRRLLLCSDDG